jgi:signal transduction histidine kinase
MHDSDDLTRSQPNKQASPAACADEPGSRPPSIAQFEELLGSVQKLATVGQLTSGVAHEFNNLLQGIVGSLELIRKLITAGRAAETEKFATAALASARRAAGLTERLLHFARPTEALRPRPIEVSSFIAAMLDLLRGTHSASIRIEVAPAADLWTAVCDPDRLEIALVNAVVNAREGMPDGGTIVIETSNVDLDQPHAAVADTIPPGQYVCISITDSGSGMSPERMQRAFDPLYRSHAASPETGLALYMVHRFAREAGGYADIESEIGRGSAVRIYVPPKVPST